MTDHAARDDALAVFTANLDRFTVVTDLDIAAVDGETEEYIADMFDRLYIGWYADPVAFARAYVAERIREDPAQAPEYGGLETGGDYRRYATGDLAVVYLPARAGGCHVFAEE
jgi:hypothetical protein